MTQSMPYFLYICDCSVPYCAFLEAWNWVIAGQHLNASHPRSSVWLNPNVPIFSGNYFWKTLNCHISSTVRAFDQITKLRDRPDIETTQSFLNNPSGPQSNAIKYKFITFIWSLFSLQMSTHIYILLYLAETRGVLSVTC